MMETYSITKALVSIRLLILKDETRHCEGQSPEAISEAIKGLLRGVYTEHVRKLSAGSVNVLTMTSPLSIFSHLIELVKFTKN